MQARRLLRPRLRLRLRLRLLLLLLLLLLVLLVLLVLLELLLTGDLDRAQREHVPWLKKRRRVRPTPRPARSLRRPALGSPARVSMASQVQGRRR
jgi:hypothetical protein